MEINWIILALIFVCAIVLIVFLIIRNQKDKINMIDSMNAQDDLENVIEPEKEID